VKLAANYMPIHGNSGNSLIFIGSVQYTKWYPSDHQHGTVKNLIPNTSLGRCLLQSQNNRLNSANFGFFALFKTKFPSHTPTQCIEMSLSQLHCCVKISDKCQYVDKLALRHAAQNDQQGFAIQCTCALQKCRQVFISGMARDTHGTRCAGQSMVGQKMSGQFALARG